MKSLLFLLLFVANLNAEVRLTFVGDVMLADGPGEYIKKGKNPFEFVANDLKDSDFTVGNLECPVSSIGIEYKEKPVTFRADPKTLQTLTPYFYALSVANNHSGDYGREAFKDTLLNLKNHNLKYVGGGLNLKEAHQPLLLEKNGLKIAIIAYNEYKPRSFEAGENWAGLAWSEDDQVIYDIKLAKKMGADIVIPFLHWGEEYVDRPNSRQIGLAKLMIDAGADAVVGGHPHVTQLYSHYKNKPIIWSLGNFLFDGFPEGKRRKGWILKLKANKTSVEIEKIILAHQNEMGIPKSEKILSKGEEYFPLN